MIPVGVYLARVVWVQEGFAFWCCRNKQLKAQASEGLAQQSSFSGMSLSEANCASASPFPWKWSTLDKAVRMFFFMLSLQQGGALVARHSDLDNSHRTRQVAAAI